MKKRPVLLGVFSYGVFIFGRMVGMDRAETPVPNPLGPCAQERRADRLMSPSPTPDQGLSEAGLFSPKADTLEKFWDQRINGWNYSAHWYFVDTSLALERRIKGLLFCKGGLELERRNLDSCLTDVTALGQRFDAAIADAQAKLAVLCQQEKEAVVKAAVDMLVDTAVERAAADAVRGLGRLTVDISSDSENGNVESSRALSRKKVFCSSCFRHESSLW